MTSIGVFIGRFQPLHNGHLNIIKKGIATEDFFLIMIGSINKSDELNPFSYEERVQFVRGALSNDENERVRFVGLEDSTPKCEPGWWFTQVKTILSEFDTDKIVLYGSNKDKETEKYLTTLKHACGFSSEKFIEPVLAGEIMSATKIREILRKSDRTTDEIQYLCDVLPFSVRALLCL